MAETHQGEDIDRARVMLGLLDSVERNGGQSQRHLAAELGIALGLVNAYLKRCIKKGLVKASEAPARRLVYYLTPQGFAEKSRLTVEYLSYSLGFFRQAKVDCAALLRQAQARGCRRIVLAGKSDLAEIVAICSMETDISIVATVDAVAAETRFVGRPVVPSFKNIEEQFDAIVVTDLVATRRTCEALISRFGNEIVLIPQLLHQRLLESDEDSES
jgi:DNA-binding MarR family transcriptional regulator